MTWPVYPLQTTLPPLMQHNADQRTTPTGAHVFLAAADVWRAGVHLWRSYDAQAAAESIYDWTARELGQTVATNHNNGLWRVPGVEVGDYPVPTMAAMRAVGPPKALRNLISALCAIAQLPAPPDIIAATPTAEALQMRLHRSTRGYAVIAVTAPEEVAVRLMYCRKEVVAAPSDLCAWRVTVQDRQTTHITKATHITAPRDSTPTALIREAKRCLQLTGWPAQRVPGRLEWRITHTTNQIRIEKAPHI